MITKYNLYESLEGKLSENNKNKLIDNCSYFFNNWKGKIIYRSFNSNHFHNLKKIKHYYNRAPVDTDIFIHNRFNKLFEKYFGWKVRNGVFTTQSETYSESISTDNTTYIFIPIGEYQYVYSNFVDDFYEGVIDNFYNIDEEIDIILNNKTIYDLTDEELENIFVLLEYRDFGVPCKFTEISFNSKYYYLLDTKYEKEIEDLLKQN